MSAKLNLSWKAKLPIVTTLMCTFVCSFVLSNVLIPLLSSCKTLIEPGAMYNRALEEHYAISFGQYGRPFWYVR